MSQLSIVAKNEISLIKQELANRKEFFRSILPPNVDVEKFFSVTEVAAMKDSAIRDPIVRESLILSSIDAARDGLLPDGKEAAFVIYNIKKNGQWTKAIQYMPMIKGLKKIAYRSADIVEMKEAIVYEGDHFQYVMGDEERIEHIPAMNTQEKPIVAVYVIVKTKNGIYRKVMQKWEIDKIADKSKSKKDGKHYGPWADFYDQMAIKTVYRRLFKSMDLFDDKSFDSIMSRDEGLYEFSSEREEKSKTISNINNLIEGPQEAFDEETGEIFDDVTVDNVIEEIYSCNSYDELVACYQKYKEVFSGDDLNKILEASKERKDELTVKKEAA